MLSHMDYSEVCYCLRCGAPYEETAIVDDGNGLRCPRYGCGEGLLKLNPISLPILTELYKKGFKAVAANIKLPYEGDPCIEITFKDFYNFQPLPDGFKIISPITREEAHNETPVKIFKCFDSRLSDVELYGKWLVSFAELSLWARAMPLPM